MLNQSQMMPQAEESASHPGSPASTISELSFVDVDLDIRLRHHLRLIKHQVLIKSKLLKKTARKLLPETLPQQQQQVRTGRVVLERVCEYYIRAVHLRVVGAALSGEMSLGSFAPMPFPFCSQPQSHHVAWRYFIYS